jgi:hypothetical protein
MLGDIKVDIVGRSLVTEQGKRPEFTLNANRVMELLKGDNLYERFDMVRELIQNAVDATLLRIWETDRETVEKLIAEGKAGQLPSELLAKYPITIRFQQSEDQKQNEANEQIEWLLTITDQGTGISQSDLQYITNVAGSGNNAKRRMLINSMPEWLRPSGTFGIGLQSAFMWSEQISIETKSLYTQEALDIKLHSPAGSNKGLVEIEEVNDYKRPIGTSLTISIKTAAKSFRGPWFLEPDKSILAQQMVDCDPLLDQFFPNEAYSLMDKVLETALYAPAKFNFIFPIEVFDGEIDSKITVGDFYEETNCRFSVILGTNLRDKLFYRGQLVNDDKELPSFYFFDYAIDIYSTRASDWLTFNRNSLSAFGKSQISDLVLINLKCWVEKNLNNILHNENEAYQRATLSALANVRALDGNDKFYSFWVQIARQLRDDWKKLPCDFIDNGNKISGKIIQDVLVFGSVLTNDNGYSNKIYPDNEKVACLPNTIQLAINDWLSNKDNAVSYDLIQFKQGEFKYPDSQAIRLIYKDKSDAQILIKNELLVNFIEKNLRNDFPERLLLPMDSLPEIFERSQFELKKGVKINGGKYVLELMPYPLLHFVVPYLISPKSDKPIKLEKTQFVQWMHDNLENPIDIKTTEANVMKIIDWFENLMKGSEIWQSLKKKSDIS